LSTQQRIVRFGPAGNAASFYAQGYKHTEQAPAWLAAMGLNAMEYSAGRGASLKEDTARRIGEAARAHGVVFSIHAPYYINFADPAPERYERNIGYLLDSARAVHAMGGDRVVLHVGSCAKLDPADAFANVLAGLRRARQDLTEAGFDGIRLCPETMGRDSQIGDLDAILRICEQDETFVPAIDFAHLHARGRGGLQTTEDFDAILRRLVEVLGEERAHCFHAHFCRIEYNEKSGEKRHHTFADTQFGPDFALLAPLLADPKWTPTLICESAGTQAEDACAMRDMVLRAVFRFFACLESVLVL